MNSFLSFKPFSDYGSGLMDRTKYPSFSCIYIRHILPILGPVLEVLRFGVAEESKIFVCRSKSMVVGDAL
jgi:hypothetical protein